MNKIKQFLDLDFIIFIVFSNKTSYKKRNKKLQKFKKTFLRIYI